MKKLLSLLLTVIIISSLAGCTITINQPAQNEPVQNDSDADNNASYDNGGAVPDNGVLSVSEFLDLIKNYLDVDHFTVTTEDSYCHMGRGLDYQPVYAGNKDVHLLSSNIRLDNGTELYYDMPISEFCAQGWKFEDESNASRELESNNRTLLPVNFVLNGKTLPVLIGNTTENTITLAESNVHGFDFKLYDSSDNCSVKNTTLPDFSVEGRITSDSDLGTIIDTLGEPSTVYYSISDSADKAYGFSRIKLMYKDYGGPTLMIELSNDGKTIFEFDML